ncbi:MAG TPA: bifunctional helix-turn-helix transcriptional regulator/GNAT family N-acetyltransferase [Solirubrobacteraceae bacterium]|nr:bifunctional helix-turn-helix transcriptional regulator/GNAT family N-acetyltransferase [Solirubrobacteraceae bacterium]
MSTTTPSRIAAVRAFNRFYTRRLGMLGTGLLGTDHPLPQARVLYELGQRPVTAVADLRAALDLDAGYLSRLLTSLETAGLVRRERDESDGRRQAVRLTAAGAEEFRQLDERSRAEVGELLERLTDGEQRRVLGAMHVLEDAWDGRPRREVALRDPRPGDLGWVIQRHGALYHAEYGFDAQFEALVGRIVADFAEREDARERAWIADVAGESAGCVFCTRKDDSTAQLRLLLVEPDARGMGVGARLVEQCVRFAEQAGYTSMTLWTQSVLEEAHRLYERAGFQLTGQEPHRSFGRDLVAQTWTRALSPRSRT